MTASVTPTNQPVDCLICLYPIDESKAMACKGFGHVFHKNCIEPWLEESRKWAERRDKCPLCHTRDFFTGESQNSPIHYEPINEDAELQDAGLRQTTARVISTATEWLGIVVIGFVAGAILGGIEVTSAQAAAIALAGGIGSILTERGTAGMGAAAAGIGVGVAGVSAAIAALAGGGAVAGVAVAKAGAVVAGTAAALAVMVARIANNAPKVGEMATSVGLAGVVMTAAGTVTAAATGVLSLLTVALNRMQA